MAGPTFPAAVQDEYDEPDSPVDLGLDERPPAPGGPPHPLDGEGSILGDLGDELREAVQVPETEPWECPRPGWAATFSLAVEDPVVKRVYREHRRTQEEGNRATRRRGAAADDDPTKMDEVGAMAVLLGRYNTGLYKNGRKLLAAPGRPLTFREPEFHEAIKKPGIDAAGAVRHFYGLDGPILEHGRALMEESKVSSTRPTVVERPGT